MTTPLAASYTPKSVPLPRASAPSMDHLDELEAQSIYIFREAFARLKKLALLWSLGKDSNVMIWLARKAFFGRVPFPALHVDTGKKFPEMYAFRDRYGKEWDLDLKVEPCPPIDAVDPTACVAKATASCAGLPAKVADQTSKRQLKVLAKCGLVSLAINAVTVMGLGELTATVVEMGLTQRILEQVLRSGGVRLVHESQRELIYTTNGIKQIAGNLGFADETYFGRFFRKHTGLSPREFRTKALDTMLLPDMPESSP
mgnify:CR=1 FL=1